MSRDRLRGAQLPQATPGVWRRAQRLDRGAGDAADEPVEQIGQVGCGDVARGTRQLDGGAQQTGGAVREQAAAESGRARDPRLVQGECDEELLRTVATQHGEIAPATGETRLLVGEEGAQGRGPVGPGGRADEAHRAVLGVGAGTDLLGFADAVVADEAGTGLDHRPGAAVVGPEPVGGRPGFGRHAPVELQDAVWVRLPPAVDELVVVADDEEASVRPGEKVDEGELGTVQVLELVDQQVVEASLDGSPVRGVGEHVDEGEVDLVVERLQPGGGLGAKVLAVDRGEGDGDERRRRERLDRHVHVVRRLQRGPHAGEGAHERAERVAAAARPELRERDAGRLQGAGHEAPEGASVVVEADTRTQHLALVAVAEGVERGAVHALRSVVRRGPTRAATASGPGLGHRDEAACSGDPEGGEPLLELFGGLAVEGEEQDPGGVRAAVDELDDAAHQGLRLAGSGRSQHARRPLAMLDRRTLGRVEARGIGAGCGAPTGRRPT